nr:unnamed protein product [Spirometra erinaceieuropaei]
MQLFSFIDFSLSVDLALRLGTLDALDAKKAYTGTLLIPISKATYVTFVGSPNCHLVTLLSTKFAENSLDTRTNGRIGVVTEPLEFIQDGDTIKRRRVSRRRLQEEQPEVWRAISCIKGVSEAVSRLLQPARIGIAHRPQAIIRRRLMQPKDILPPTETSAVVYQMSCNDGDCNYAGKPKEIVDPPTSTKTGNSETRPKLTAYDSLRRQ